VPGKGYREEMTFRLRPEGLADCHLVHLGKGVVKPGRQEGMTT
jgi:hypothetical protein